MFATLTDFSESDHDLWEAQVYQDAGFGAFVPTIKRDRSLFHALQHKSGSGAVYSYRKSGVTPDPDLDLRTIAQPPDPAKAVNFDGHEAAPFISASGALFVTLATDNGTTFDVWALISEDGGTTWKAYPVAHYGWSRFYLRSMEGP